MYKRQGIIRLVDINTAHFTGNYPPGAMIEAGHSADGDISKVEWKTLVDQVDLGPDLHHILPTNTLGPVNMVRLNIYPDGGVARLRLFGDVNYDWENEKSDICELSALKLGGCILGYNDAHYGDVNALLSEGRGLTMGDGWESRRRRQGGHDWCIIKLGVPGVIRLVDINTAHFTGNYPPGAMIEAGHSADGDISKVEWKTLVDQVDLGPDSHHILPTNCLLYTSPSPRDAHESRMPSSA